MSTDRFPVLSQEQFISNLRAKRASLNFYALYNSYAGGIITDPALMTIPLDDHMCHRGHAVFDTAVVSNGWLYTADPHIARLLRSAATAKINHTFTAAFIKEVIVAVVKASGQTSADIRLWITAGPGDFSISPAGCQEPCLYVVAFGGFPMPHSVKERTVLTSVVGLRGAPIQTMKSSNYLANVLLLLEAKRKGGHFGLWAEMPAGVAPPTDRDANAPREAIVKEGPINALMVVKRDGSVVSPPPADILDSITAMRVFELLRAAGGRPYVGYQEITVGDVLDAVEVFFVGGGNHVVAVKELDGHAIGDGNEGPVCKAMHDAIVAEAANGSAYAERILP